MLTEAQDQLLIGSILGDSHVERNCYNCRVRFHHSAQQKQYVYYKHKMLAPYVTQVVEGKKIDKRTNKTYKRVSFNTKTLACFNPYRESFYREGKKTIPENIGERLVSRLALAVWYLDDGAKRIDCKAFRLHTNDFSIESVLLLQRTLLSNYGIVSSIQKQDATKRKGERGFLLAIGSRGGQAEKFSAIIKPVVATILPSMLYKFF